MVVDVVGKGMPSHGAYLGDGSGGTGGAPTCDDWRQTSPDRWNEMRRPPPAADQDKDVVWPRIASAGT
jgi:hypothetical protein